MAENRVSIGRLKARLSEYLNRVRAGEPVLVTDRGKPVARLVPLEGEPAIEARVASLAQAGLVRRPETKLPDDFLDMTRPSDAQGRSLEMVLAERAESW